MEKLDLILWFLGAGFSVMFTLMMLMWHSLNSKIEKHDEDFKEIRDELKKMNSRDAQTETRMAVIESRIGDISTNVTHLMWQHQVPLQNKDAKEQ